MSTIESVLQESRLFVPDDQWVAQAHLSKADYDEMQARAVDDYEGYWAQLARDNLVWHRPFTKVLNETNAPFYKWFEDGHLNASYICLDRHQLTQPNRPPIIFEADDGTVTKVTYNQLYQRVCQFANGLKLSSKVVKHFSVKTDIIYCAGTASAMRKTRMVPDTSKIQEKFSLKMTVSLDKAIERTVQWYLQDRE